MGNIFLDWFFFITCVLVTISALLGGSGLTPNMLFSSKREIATPEQREQLIDALWKLKIWNVRLLARKYIFDVDAWNSMFEYPLYTPFPKLSESDIIAILKCMARDISPTEQPLAYRDIIIYISQMKYLKACMKSKKLGIDVFNIYLKYEQTFWNNRENLDWMYLNVLSEEERAMYWLMKV